MTQTFKDNCNTLLCH